MVFDIEDRKICVGLHFRFSEVLLTLFILPSSNNQIEYWQYIHKLKTIFIFLFYHWVIIGSYLIIELFIVYLYCQISFLSCRYMFALKLVISYLLLWPGFDPIALLWFEWSPHQESEPINSHLSVHFLGWCVYERIDMVAKLL